MRAAMPRGNCKDPRCPLSFPRGDCHSPKSSDAFPHLTPGQSSPTQKCQPASLAGRGEGAAPRLRPHAVAVQLHPGQRPVHTAMPQAWRYFYPVSGAPSIHPGREVKRPSPGGGSGSMHPVPVTLHTAEGGWRGETHRASR